MYFVGIATALAAEVYEQKALIVTLGNTTNYYYYYYQGKGVQCGGGEVLEVPNNMAPLWALSSMLLLSFFYTCIFLVAIITTYTT